MGDLFRAEQIEKGWRVVRYVAAGDGTPERIVLPKRFRQQHTAERQAYLFQVAHERRPTYHPYLGD